MGDLQKHERRMFLDVSACMSRVIATAASSSTQAAHQIDPDTRSADDFRDTAWAAAETLEREARNIRDAVMKYHAARTGAQEGEKVTPPGNKNTS